MLLSIFVFEAARQSLLPHTYLICGYSSHMVNVIATFFVISRESKKRRAKGLFQINSPFSKLCACRVREERQITHY